MPSRTLSEDIPATVISPTNPIKDDVHTYDEYKELASTEQGRADLLARAAMGVDNTGRRIDRLEERMSGVEKGLETLDTNLTELRRNHRAGPKFIRANVGSNGNLKSIGIILGAAALIIIGILKAVGKI